MYQQLLFSKYKTKEIFIKKNISYYQVEDNKCKEIQDNSIDYLFSKYKTKEIFIKKNL